MPDDHSPIDSRGGQSGLPVISPDTVEQDHPDEIDNIIPSRGYQMLPLVALGGSAGSIPALQRFFAAMPAESGMAFVVVIHLAPENESIMDEILARSTTMKVVQAKDNQKVEANTVYVIPPGKFLSATDGSLRVTPLEPERGKRVAVDLFFRTLADTHGPTATAIILSGADGDGALGIKRIKERGGLTVAQDPEEAEHPSMPRSAIATGMVDWVLPVDGMPAKLVEYRANGHRLQLPSEDGPQPAKVPPTAHGEEENALRDVLNHLRSRTGRDFTYYKRATIVRRISRRMQVNGVATMPEYLLYLRTHPGEAGALQQDLLISVTNFFRDREAFAALEAEIPGLFAGKTTADSVRVWSAGCATGDEAYSIAMLLLEQSGRMDSPPMIQVFATDLADDAIVAAREALFPLTIQADVSEERLRRFFVKEHRGYRARRELRECVLFAAHDLLKDAPFSRIDLFTCRNLLIYLTQDAQKRVFDIAHFALRPGGLLFIGTSESVDEESPQWEPVDKKHRIYRQRPLPRTHLPVPIGPSTLTRAFEAQDRARSGPFIHAAAFSAAALVAVRHDAEAHDVRISWEELHYKLIERFAPPSVIVTRDHDIVHMSENAGQFLQFTGGEPSINLLRVVHPMLRVELRAALFRAAQTSAATEAFRVPVLLDGKTLSVDIRVCPAQDIAPDYLLVVFQVRAGEEGGQVQTQVAAEPAVRHLEREIEQMKTRLRDTIEQYEASSEELKASNEELQAMNEELRSSAEELETSREELQSVNEELTTVNHELKSKVDELGRSNADLNNLMAATGVATIFLDRQFAITRYTPSAVALFRLIPTDLGRPLTDLSHELRYPELRADAERVLETLIPVKREVTDGEHWYLAQLLPYRTSEDRIAGVVLSFVDVTEARAAALALSGSEERLRLILESAKDYAIITLDLGRRIQSWNPGAERMLGYSGKEILGESGDVIFTPEDRAQKAPEQEAETALREGRAADERWHMRKDGSTFWGSGVMSALRDPSGNAIGLVKIFRDQTEQRNTQKALEESRAELMRSLAELQQAQLAAEAAREAKDHFLAVLSHELRTPLTPVIMAVHTLQRTKDLPPVVGEALKMIERNIMLEARFVDDLLDVTRIERGKLELDREPLDLHEIVRQAVDVSTADIESKNQRLTVALDASHARLNGDRVRLQQLFWNLLKNASKFTSEKGMIAVKSRNEPGRIVVSVSDNGIGFSEEEATRLFDPFKQADVNITREYGGLGLGLAIAEAVAQGHGGSVHAASGGRGKGATFSVELPLDELGSETGGSTPDASVGKHPPRRSAT
jgi:two-component system CheB/CheR fusion protein